MSSNSSLGDPFTIATLTKPVSSSNGRARAAGVCSISGIKKRKRTELAVGLDGEGVSIYSLQNPQLVSAYALPSSTTFTTAPFSIYRKGSSKRVSHRYTYASVKNLSQSEKPQLVCFHDKIIGDKTETSKTKYAPSNNAQILAIDALPVTAGGSSKDATHDILATFDNGDVICLSADVETVRWVGNLHSLIPNADANTKLYHFTLATARTVARGLLRGREDLTAILVPSSESTSTLPDLTQILCVLSRNADGADALTLVQIQPRSADLNTPQLSPLKELVSWQLPHPATSTSLSTSPPQYALHAATGALHMVIGTAILSYTFAGITPKITSELSFPDLDVESFLRLSPDSVLTASRQTLRLLDVKFGSLQAVRSVEDTTTADSRSPAKKRKTGNVDNTKVHNKSYHLIAYHAEANLIVALRENEIVGIEHDVSSSRKRRKVESTTLLEALGKGLTPQSVMPAAHHLEKFEERKTKLDRYVSKGKIAKFEHAFAADLGIELLSPTTKATEENETNGGPLTNGVGPKITDEDAMAIEEEVEAEEDELRNWIIPNTVPATRRLQYDQYALYALSKIFEYNPAGAKELGSSLRIQFFPPNAFEWLVRTGYLTKESIRRSIDRLNPQAAVLSSVNDKDILKALMEFDPDLFVLSAILNERQHLPISSVVQVIKLLMQSLDDQPETTEAPKLLTNGTTQHEDKMDVDIDSELEAATHEVEHAMSMLNQGLLIRSNTLCPALIRLHRFSPSLISSTLRSILPRHDLETLIRLLHSEMKNGGWSKLYDFKDVSEESPTDAPFDNAVAIIASLLSCALDAIGAGAWLTPVGNNPSSTDSSDIFQALYDDTAEALTGFWEARYMRGLLSEFLRFANNVPKSQKPSSEWLEANDKPFTVSPDVSELPMLPLGSKPDMGIERMKNGKGGKKEERSKREMGMLISRRVPKYSFERIVI